MMEDRFRKNPHGLDHDRCWQVLHSMGPGLAGTAAWGRTATLKVDIQC